MNNQTLKIFSQIFVMFIAALVLASCNGNNADNFPQVASPPPFDYLDGEELRSGMHQLAFTMLRLDRALSDDEEMEPGDQEEIVSNLQDIKLIAEGLQDGDIRSTHPYLAVEMYRFLNDVDQALWQASLRTPRYYMAGRVSGACVACHSASW